MDRSRGPHYQNFQNNRRHIRVCPPRDNPNSNSNLQNGNFNTTVNRSRRVILGQNPEPDYRNPSRNFTNSPAPPQNNDPFSVFFNATSNSNWNFGNCQNAPPSYNYSPSIPGQWSNNSNNSSPLIRDRESSPKSNFSYEQKLKKHCADEAYLNLKVDFEKCQEKIQSLNSDNLRLENSAKNLRQKMFNMKAEHSKEIDGLKSKIVQQKCSMKQEIDSLKSEKIRLQEITKILDNLLRDESNDNELFIVEKDMELCQNGLEGGKFVQINKLTKDLNSSRNEVDGLNFEKIKLQKENQLLKSQIRDKGEICNEDYKKRISELEKKVSEYKSIIQKEKSKVSAKNHKIQELYGENDVFRNRIIELENHVKKLEKMKNELKKKHEKNLNEVKIGFDNDLKKLEKLELDFKRKCNELDRKNAVIQNFKDHANQIFDTFLAIEIEED